MNSHATVPLIYLVKDYDLQVHDAAAQAGGEEHQQDVHPKNWPKEVNLFFGSLKGPSDMIRFAFERNYSRCLDLVIHRHVMKK